MDALRSFTRDTARSLDTLVVDSSLVLELYGLRRANDIDILIDENRLSSSYGSHTIRSHDEAIDYHRKSKLELIYDSRHHFIYQGIKFVGFNELLAFKRQRAEEKDRHDVCLMKAIQERGVCKKWIGYFTSKVFYFRSAARRKFPAWIRGAAKRIGIYEALRATKRKL
jgi:hypothetical protein